MKVLVHRYLFFRLPFFVFCFTLYIRIVCSYVIIRIQHVIEYMFVKVHFCRTLYDYFLDCLFSSSKFP